jgi:glycogen operon protein
MRVAGEAIDEREARGVRISDETLLVLLNSYHEALTFTFPEAGGEDSCQWELVMDTQQAAPPRPSGKNFSVGSRYAVTARALALFRRVASRS